MTVVRSQREVLRVLSLGAGVQSTTMALMAAHGEITPMPDCAIFADTQAEPHAVYKHLRWLMSPNVLPFPVHIITAGNLRAAIMRPRKTGKFPEMPLPAFVEGGGLVDRQCTADYKIRPIIKQIRKLLGITRRRSPVDVVVEQWIGISTDEIMRMKPARDAWIANRWPLIEKRMSRGDCLEWLKRHDYPIPGKSACTFCPFHANATWRNMKRNDPEKFADAVAVDSLIRNARDPSKGQFFLHRQCVPLADVDLSTAEDRGQLNLFNNECEGMCGV